MLCCAALVVVVLHWFHIHRVGCTALWNVIAFLFPVKERIITTKDGESVIEWDLVKVVPLVKSPGYALLNNDPDVYGDEGDFDGFCPDREWPDEELASHPDPAPIPQPSPAPSPTISASDSQVKKLLESHHLLKSIGIDPCLEYQQGQAAYHLAKVRKGDVQCPICSRSCSYSQKLKNHIRARHQEVTAFRCPMCSKSFGDSHALKVHREGHLRTIASHEKGCKDNPANQQQARIRKHECGSCNAAYFHKKDLNRHIKLAHHSAPR